MPLGVILVPFLAERRWVEITKEFWRLWNFPFSLRTISGKHVWIRATSNSRSDYYNYKGYFLIILMAACDATYRFTYAYGRAYGHERNGCSLASFGSCLISSELHLPFFQGPKSSAHVFLRDEDFPCRKIWWDHTQMSSSISMQHRLLPSLINKNHIIDNWNTFLFVNRHKSVWQQADLNLLAGQSKIGSEKCV